KGSQFPCARFHTHSLAIGHVEHSTHPQPSRLLCLAGPPKRRGSLEGRSCLALVEAECSHHRARASSSSITRVKLSSGWAPETSRPLMQKAGVPVTPARVPSSSSCCTVAWYLPLLTHGSQAGRSSPTSWAEALSCSGLVCGAW